MGGFNALAPEVNRPVLGTRAGRTSLEDDRRSLSRFKSNHSSLSLHVLWLFFQNMVLYRPQSSERNLRPHQGQLFPPFPLMTPSWNNWVALLAWQGDIIGLKFGNIGEWRSYMTQQLIFLPGKRCFRFIDFRSCTSGAGQPIIDPSSNTTSVLRKP